MYSYSSLKDYAQCPRLYYEKRIAKTVKFVQSAAAAYGVRLHTAFEEYVRDGVALPDEFVKHEPLLQALLSQGGKPLCEHLMAVDGGMNAVPYYDPAIENPQAWEHNPAAHIGGAADLLTLHGSFAVYADYKSGKGAYPDLEQCELMSMLCMITYPHIEEVHSALLFVDAGKLIDKSYNRADLESMWLKWNSKIARIEQSKRTGVWQERPNNLCGWCAVEKCPNHP